MKFAHLADCHIGSWRDPKLRDLNIRAFGRAVDICIEKKVDFLLIAGDLFNTSLPPIDMLKFTVKQFIRLKDNYIAIYLIAGSHDYSPSGKTILDVLESIGLFVNVAKGITENGKLKLKFTFDNKTNAKITGILGKKLGLDKKYYEGLDRESLEKEEGFKILLFHNAISEFKPKDMTEMIDAPLSLLPKGFDYYAGGHVHFVFQKNEKGYGLIAYPGPLFPNNFKELEELQKGGFYIYDDGKLDWQPLQIVNVFPINIKCDHKTPEQVKDEIFQQIENKEFFETIVMIRLSGTLESGKQSDIDFKEIFDFLYDKSAYYVMKNTNSLSTKEFEEIKVDFDSVEKLEDNIIKEHSSQSKLELIEKDKIEVLKELMDILKIEREEDERQVDFDKRIIENFNKLIKLD